MFFTIPFVLGVVIPLHDKPIDNQTVNASSHHTFVGIIGTTNDGFSPYIERGVDDKRNPGALPNFLDKVIISWMGDKKRL